MKKIKCIIIDDEPLAQDLLEGYILQTPFLELIGKFTIALEALPLLQQKVIDLIFLDIEMPDIKGMEFANLIKDNTKIIFTTAYSQYAAQSYEKNAVDYLLKPISFERFLIAVNKLITRFPEEVNKLESDADFIFVKTNGQYIRIAYREIGFIEALKDYVLFHKKDEKLVVYHSLKKLEPILPNSFLRVHYSYIVNFNCVERYKDYHLHIFEHKIPVSRRYRDIVQQQIEQYLI